MFCINHIDKGKKGIKKQKSICPGIHQKSNFNFAGLKFYFQIFTL